MSIARLMQQAAARVGGTVPPSPETTSYGPVYGNWDGSYINVNVTAPPSTTSNNFSGIDSSYDAVNNRLYDAYAGNNSYAYFPGLVPTGAANNLPNKPVGSGRGSTVAYQNGSSYVLMSNASNNKIDVWKIGAGGAYTYKGGMFGSSPNGGIAFAQYDSNSYFFTTTNGSRLIYRHPLPDLESLSSQSIANDREYIVTANLGFNLSFIGEDGNGDLYFAFKHFASTAGVNINKISKTAPNGAYFTGRAISSGVVGYNLWVDYSTPRIYAGGLSSSLASFWTV